MPRHISSADDLLAIFPRSLNLNKQAKKTFKAWFIDQAQDGNITFQALPDIFEPTLGAFRQGSESSRRAAVEHFMKSGTQRRLVFEILARKGKYGATNVELEQEAGLGRPSGSSRRLELMKAGLVRPTKKTRPTKSGTPTTVYVLTALGRKVWADIRVSGLKAS